MKRTKSQAGFTLVEVLMAVLILAMVTVVLLGRRVEIVRDTREARDRRLAWVLAAQKMGELELDSKVVEGEGGSSSGDFHDVGEEYAGFLYQWSSAKEDVVTSDPTSRDIVKKQVFRVKLAISRSNEEGDLMAVEGIFPVPKKSGGSP